MAKQSRIAIIGSGPTALMACEQVAGLGFAVDLFEKNSGYGRKLLIAGSTGLNIGNNYSFESFLKFCTSDSLSNHLEISLASFFTKEWLDFVEKELGFKTFLGTSGRYFIEEMHANNFVKVWIERLKNKNVTFYPQHELKNFENKSDKSYTLQFQVANKKEFYYDYDAVGLFLGGGSWEQNLPSWPNIFAQKEIHCINFSSNNVGYSVFEWSEAFLEEAEGLAIKDCILKTSRGEKRGDLIITKYGLEGTPLYFLGATGPAIIDLMPNLSETAIIEILSRANSKDKLLPLRRIKKSLNLSLASLALLYHLCTPDQKNDLETMCKLIKNFPITLLTPRPLKEAISSHGGVSLQEVNIDLMCLKMPGLFLAGEMLNWSAPTGGFLIQLCVSQGYIAGQKMLKYLDLVE